MNKIGKRAQLMALYFPIMTLFMCGLVVGIYTLQKADLQNSLVSPAEVLKLQDQKEILELRERALMIKSANEVGWGSDVENKFYELLESEGEEVRRFLFSDLNYGDRGKDWGFQNAGAEVQFLKTNKIYEFDFENNVLKVRRNELGKSFRLAADEKSKINFVVDVGYEYDKEILIREGDL